MPDGLRFKMITAPVQAEMLAMSRRTDRATMWALREVGRRVKREGRKGAPVATGALKKSISSSRRLKRRGPGDYSLVVGARGERVHLYAAKAEARTPYMAPAFRAAERDAEALHAKAWARAMRR